MGFDLLDAEIQQFALAHIDEDDLVRVMTLLLERNGLAQRLREPFDDGMRVLLAEVDRLLQDFVLDGAVGDQPRLLKQLLGLLVEGLAIGGHELAAVKCHKLILAITIEGGFGYLVELEPGRPQQENDLP